MTHGEILDAIAADPALQALVPNAGAIALMLSTGRTRLVPTPIGVGRVMDTLGPAEGAAVLDTLDGLRATVPAIKWAFVLLERGELDVSLASVRGQIDALTVAGVFTPEQAAALKALAEQPEDVSEFDVRCAIYNDDGTLRV